MKPIQTVLLTLLFTGMALVVLAQPTVGIKGGYTMAWEFYNTDLPDDAEITVNGFNVSGLLYWDLGQHFQIGTEPGFAKRGAACIPGWQPIFEGDTKFTLNYAELPLMGVFHLPLWKGNLSLYGKAGLGVSTLISAFSETTQVGIEEPISRDRIPLGEFSLLNRWDFGIYNSAGVGIKFGPGQLLIESDFYTGLRDVERFNTSKNRSIDLNLGYLINL